eukprot:GHVS01058168.1.p1 GENE.GHVS01058168.1~~GHVS01058168.1.p1  ORF type:complete len:834 (-),score=140.20 GHVS01058168.1:562-2787(-)
MQNQYVLLRCDTLLQYQQHNNDDTNNGTTTDANNSTNGTTTDTNKNCTNKKSTASGGCVEFLNPNIWSADGVRSVSGCSFCEDGSLVAYAVADKGSDWNDIYFGKVVLDNSKPIEQLDDVLHHARFTSLAWTHDNLGIFYNTIDAKGRSRADGIENDVAENHKLFYHRIGTPQSDDILACSFPDHPEWMSGVCVSHDGRYLFLSVYQGCEPSNQLWFCDMSELPPLLPSDTSNCLWLNRDMQTISSRWHKLIDTFSNSYEYTTNYNDKQSIDSYGGGCCDTSNEQQDSIVTRGGGGGGDDILVIRTNRNCKAYKLVSINVTKWLDEIRKRQTEKKQKQEICSKAGLGELAFDSLSVDLVTAGSCGAHLVDFAFRAAKTLIVVHFFKDVKSLLQVRCMYTGELIRDFPLDVGTVTTASGNRVHTELLVNFSNFLTPSQIFHVELSRDSTTQKPELMRNTQMPCGYGYDVKDFLVEQVFYDGKDGTSIPMFVVRKKSAKLDGSNPTLLYAYGGFNICEYSSFSVSRLIWISKLGGVFALANIRGGGEYGQQWHEAARKLNRQVAFDDFQCAADYLIKANYTRPDKLAIQGGSNGGLLVTICMLQRPELYRAVVADVPVTDLLRFHKFTAGQVWKTEYGDPDEETDFKFLHSISPLHKLASSVGQLPSLLVTTSDHDDRVSPLHSLKFIATLRHTGVQPNSRPHLLRVETSAGHGFGKPTEKLLEESADRTCFLADQLEMEWTD